MTYSKIGFATVITRKNETFRQVCLGPPGYGSGSISQKDPDPDLLVRGMDPDSPLDPVGKFFFASLKSMKKEVGSGSISQRYGSGYPDPHQNVTDPQHWYLGYPSNGSKNDRGNYRNSNIWRLFSLSMPA